MGRFLVLGVGAPTDCTWHRMRRTTVHSNSNGHAHPCTYRAAHSHSNPGTYGYSYINTKAHRYTQSHTYPHPHSYAGPDCYTDF